MDQNYVKKVQVFKEGTKTQIAVDNLLTSERINSVSLFDGLGRPMQQVTVAGSPSQIDVVQPFVYDTIGRERFKYLPYTSSTTGIYKSNPISAQLTFYLSQANVVHYALPVSETIFDNSPLNRTYKQGGPGLVWKVVKASGISNRQGHTTPQEAKYLRLDANGYIDKSNLRQGLTNLGTVGGNYSSLLRLAEDKQIIEVYTQNKFETSLGEKDMGQPTFESTLDVMYGIEGGGKSKEEYAASHPNYSADKEWSGWFGVALFPDEAGGQGSTLSGNIQIYVNSNAQNADKKQGYKKMTSTFAHEAYGHVLYKLLGLPHSHGSKKSLTSDSPDNNKALENQIYNRENEADKNFDLQFK